MNHTRRSISRRRFLQTGTAALAAPLIVPSHLRAAPSERISVGVIGLGSRGFNLLDALLAEPDAQVVAVCDVDELHYRDRTWGKGNPFGRIPAQKKVAATYAKNKKSGTDATVDVYADFREVCQRDDIDAIVVATPDHWHALCTMEALKHSKDVYCEKPVTHLFAEGQQIFNEVARRNAVFQTGSQQRSDPEFRHAVQLIRNGILGELRSIEVGLPPGYETAQGDTLVLKVPDHLDYEMWCGPSEKLPYMQARHHRWWRGHRAYGGGVLMDWIGHHNDIAHWSLDLDNSGPSEVEAFGWTKPDTDVYNTPFHYGIRCQYAGGVTSTISDANQLGTKWLGENGWIHVTRGKLTASDERWTDFKFNAGSFALPHRVGHMRNFLDCVKSRKQCVAPAETAHRSITPGHLGYVSHALGRALKWNPATETVVDDPEANELLHAINYRQPWVL